MGVGRLRAAECSAQQGRQAAGCATLGPLNLSSCRPSFTQPVSSFPSKLPRKRNRAPNCYRHGGMRRFVSRPHGHPPAPGLASGKVYGPQTRLRFTLSGRGLQPGANHDTDIFRTSTPVEVLRTEPVLALPRLLRDSSSGGRAGTAADQLSGLERAHLLALRHPALTLADVAADRHLKPIAFADNLNFIEVCVPHFFADPNEPRNPGRPDPAASARSDQ
jgi:hypothetical protein